MYNSYIKIYKIYESKAVRKYTVNKNFSALEDLGYKKTQPVKVYESSMSFWTKREETTILDVKSHYDLAAAWWDIASSSAKGFLQVAGVALDTMGYLKDAAEPVREHEYYYSGGIEVTVYDPTTCKSDVEVKTCSI